MDQSTSVAVLTAFGILLVAIGAWLQAAQRAQEARLAHFIDRFREGAEPQADDEAPRQRESELVQRLNRLLSHQEFVQRVRLDLVRAGIRLKPTQFFLLRVGLAFAGLVVAYSLSFSFPLVLRLVLLVAGAVGGYLLVKPYLGFRQRRRIAAFEKPFPDALDIMVGALEAGGSLTSAIELVSREMPAPLSTEFSRLLRDIGLGVSYEEAFNLLYERVPSDDLGMMVSAVSIQFRVGGNLADVLKILSQTVRDRVRIRGEIKTLTSQQVMSARIITGLPFLLTGVLFTFNAAYMSHLFDPGLPRLLAVMGVVLVIIGNWVIRKLIAIEV